MTLPALPPIRSRAVNLLELWLFEDGKWRRHGVSYYDLDEFGYESAKAEARKWMGQTKLGPRRTRFLKCIAVHRSKVRRKATR